MKTKSFILGFVSSLLVLHSSFTRAATTINAVNRYAYGANIGWMDWRGDTNNGAIVNATYCSGSIYAANVGWISLGAGTPTNGVQYQNLSATDYGVNVDAFGNLRGYAYGANVGWINFETNGAASVDFTSGNLTGYAYGANVGWISLSNAAAYVQTAPLAPPNDQCAGALVLADGVPFTMGTTNATSTGDPTPGCVGSFGKGVWFTYTAPASGDVFISTCGSTFDTAMGVYTGGCGALTQVACDDDNGPNCVGLQASVHLVASGGTTYYILAGGYGSSSGNLTVEAYLVPVLNVIGSAGNVTVMWPGNGTLQSATNLSPVINWTDLTNGGGLWSEPMTNPAKFFRIKK
jgi:hypothetical protein